MSNTLQNIQQIQCFCLHTLLGAYSVGIKLSLTTNLVLTIYPFPPPQKTWAYSQVIK